MRMKSVLEESDVQRIVLAAAEEARRNAWMVSIAVVDDGGHLLAFTRMDKAILLSAEAAIGKARTAAISRRPSKFFEEMVANGRLAIVSLPYLLLEGGEPILVDGYCIGAVGVSGAKSSEDAQIARVGMSALSDKGA